MYRNRRLGWVLGSVALVAVVALWGGRATTRAQTNNNDCRTIEFGLMSLGPGEMVRVNASFAHDHCEIAPPEPVKVHITIHDSSGAEIMNSDGRPIALDAVLREGEGVFLEYDPLIRVGGAACRHRPLLEGDLASRHAKYRPAPHDDRSHRLRDPGDEARDRRPSKLKIPGTVTHVALGVARRHELLALELKIGIERLSRLPESHISCSHLQTRLTYGSTHQLDR